MTSKPDLAGQAVLDSDLTRSRTLPIGEGKAAAAPAEKSGVSAARDRSSVIGTGTNNIEWVDWLDEYKQYKEAKIRAEFEGFTMPTKPMPAYQGAGHLIPGSSSEASGSGSVFSDSPPVESAMSPNAFSRPIASRLPSDPDPLAISPQTSRNEDSSHRRSMSIRSLQAHELAKSSTHRLTTFFERPRNASTSTNRSTSSFAEGLPKGKKHLGTKIEGWWKSVKSNFASEPAAPKTSKHASGLSRQSPAAAGPSSQAQSSRISLHTALPSSVKRADPSTPSSPTVVGFFPSNAVKTSPPVASLRNVTSAFDLKSGRSHGSPTAPGLSAHPTARPRAISQQIDFDRRPTQEEMSHSFGSSSSGGQSDETMSRNPTLLAQTLEQRRNQPRLSLKLERPSVDIPEASTGASTAAGSSVSSTDRPGPSRPPGMGPSSRHSSGMTDPEGANTHLLPGHKPPQWSQTPSPLYAVLPDDPRDPANPGSRKPSASATTYPAFNPAAMHREIRQRLTTQKEVCNKELKKIIHLITLFVEEQLREVENTRNEAMEHEAYASAMDSASDFGGDESDRGDPPAHTGRRVSRTHSRRTSISNGSPVKRQQLLPRLPGGMTSPSRRQSNANPPLRGAQQTELRLAARKLSASVAHPSSNSSSRSTSRSRSPLPPGSGYLSPDAFSADGQAMPNVFILTLQEIIGIATEILDMSISQLTAKPGRCPEFVQKVQQVGTAWDDHPDWPGRGW